MRAIRCWWTCIVCFTTNSFAAVAKNPNLQISIFYNLKACFSPLSCWRNCVKLFVIVNNRYLHFSCNNKTFRLSVLYNFLQISLMFWIIKLMIRVFLQSIISRGRLQEKKPRLSGAPGSLTNALAVRKKREGQADCTLQNMP